MLFPRRGSIGMGPTTGIQVAFPEYVVGHRRIAEPWIADIYEVLQRISGKSDEVPASPTPPDSHSDWAVGIDLRSDLLRRQRQRRVRFQIANPVERLLEIPGIVAHGRRSICA